MPRRPQRRPPTRRTAARPRAARGRVPDLSASALLGLHRALLLPRLIEEKMLILLRQGKLSKWFSGIGQEAIAVGVTAALEPDDWILPMHRNLGVFTGRGLDLLRLLRQLLGREGGFTRGRDRTFHFGVPEQRIVGMISHLGAMLPVADGLALAATLRGETRVAAAFTGDGATSEGDFHEAANLAAVWKLPVLFIIENNQYGLSTPVAEQYACRDLALRGAGYGMPGEVVDGNDLLAVHAAVRRAAGRARAGGGPALLEFKTFRMRGHEEASGTDYVPKELLKDWSRRDPVLRFEAELIGRGLLTAAAAAKERAALKARIDALADEALVTPEPESTPERELADVHAPALQLPRPDSDAGSPDAGSPDAGSAGAGPDDPPPTEMRYIDAIRDGLRRALARDPRVLLLGQDIAEYGGVFKATEGLAAEFGRARVRNTPIIESGALGAALGLALDGFVPMVEMQFGDFISCGFNQVVNNLAKTHYRWGSGVPVVIRCPVGGGTGAGPFHSQNIEAWFTHVPGLKVVAPATPADARGLLLAAFADGNPVLYLEHKFLYRQAKGEVPAAAASVPIGVARVARAGDDATIVTWGVGVPWALEAATTLAAEGASIEVIDLRTLLPWDRECVLASVRRTGRLLVLHEATLTGGFGAEIAATVSSEAFEHLDAPPARLGALDTPIPFSRGLEESFSPRRRVLPELRRLLAY